MFVAQHRLERLRHAFRRSAAADIKEVCWLAARQFAHVERSHRKARAVYDAADIAIEADIGKATVIGIAFARILALVTQLRDLRAAVQRVVIERHLGVERHNGLLLGDDERVDLEHRDIEIAEGAIAAHVSAPTC